jgi:hypothetical protein
VTAQTVLPVEPSPTPPRQPRSRRQAAGPVAALPLVAVPQVSGPVPMSYAMAKLDSSGRLADKGIVGVLGWVAESHSHRPLLHRLVDGRPGRGERQMAVRGDQGVLLVVLKSSDGPPWHGPKRAVASLNRRVSLSRRMPCDRGHIFRG